MRLSNSEHESHAWRIAEIAPDFRLEDAWALPAQGGAGDFERLLEVMASLDPVSSGSRTVRALFAIRQQVGRRLGWDRAPRAPAIPRDADTTLAARLPEDLRNTVTGTDHTTGDFAFHPLYRTDREWAAELSNRTVHAVMHLAWVEQGADRYRGQMGVYVKPRGALGAAYMAVIAPFRHRIVYPALMREIERAWTASAATPADSAASATEPATGR